MNDFDLMLDIFAGRFVEGMFSRRWSWAVDFDIQAFEEV